MDMEKFAQLAGSYPGPMVIVASDAASLPRLPEPVPGQEIYLAICSVEAARRALGMPGFMAHRVAVVPMRFEEFLRAAPICP